MNLRNAGQSIALARICKLPSKRIALLAQKIVTDTGRGLTNQQAAEATQALNAGILAGQGQTFPDGAAPCDEIELDFALLAARNGIKPDAWEAAGQGK